MTKTKILNNAVDLTILRTDELPKSVLNRTKAENTSAELTSKDDNLRSKGVIQTQQHRSESLTVTLTWPASK